MNAEQIRAEAIDVLARNVYECRGMARSSDPAWDEASEARREMFVWTAEKAADALAAAGLLPVETQRLAAYAALDTSDEHLVERYLTEWREVAE